VDGRTFGVCFDLFWVCLHEVTAVSKGGVAPFSGKCDSAAHSANKGIVLIIPKLGGPIFQGP
jgi:hypothetical protein